MGLPLGFRLVWGNCPGLEARTLKLGMTGHHILCVIVIGEKWLSCQVGRRDMRSLGDLNSMLILFFVCVQSGLWSGLVFSPSWSQSDLVRCSVKLCLFNKRTPRLSGEGQASSQLTAVMACFFVSHCPAPPRNLTPAHRSPSTSLIIIGLPAYGTCRGQLWPHGSEHSRSLS